MKTLTTKKETNYIDGLAGSLYIDDGGNSDKLVPVLFLHSFGGSTEHWRNQLEHVRSSRRAIALDFRGHGKSEEPFDEAFSVYALAADIAAVVDSLKLKKIILIGHSQGGSAAIAYAKKYPKKVAGLLITGTPGHTPQSQADQVVASLESPSYQKVMDEYMKRLTTGAKPEVEALVNHGVDKISKDNSIRLIKALFEFNPLPILEDYKGPTLIISTASENKQPTSLHNQLKSIPSESIEGTSHWIQLDKPEEFNQMLDNFLLSVDQQD